MYLYLIDTNPKSTHRMGLSILNSKPIARRVWLLALFVTTMTFAATGAPAAFALLCVPAIVSILRIVFWFRQSSDELDVFVSAGDDVEVLFDNEDLEKNADEPKPLDSRTTLTPSRKRRMFYLFGHGAVIVGCLPLVLMMPFQTVPISTVVSLGCTAVAPIAFLLGAEVRIKG